MPAHDSNRLNGGQSDAAAPSARAPAACPPLEMLNCVPKMNKREVLLCCVLAVLAACGFCAFAPRRDKSPEQAIAWEAGDRKRGNACGAEARARGRAAAQDLVVSASKPFTFITEASGRATLLLTGARISAPRVSPIHSREHSREHSRAPPTTAGEMIRQNDGGKWMATQGASDRSDRTGAAAGRRGCSAARLFGVAGAARQRAARASITQGPGWWALWPPLRMTLRMQSRPRAAPDALRSCYPLDPVHVWSCPAHRPWSHLHRARLSRPRRTQPLVHETWCKIARATRRQGRWWWPLLCCSWPWRSRLCQPRHCRATSGACLAAGEPAAATTTGKVIRATMTTAARPPGMTT